MPESPLSSFQIRQAARCHPHLRLETSDSTRRFLSELTFEKGSNVFSISTEKKPPSELVALFAVLFAGGMSAKLTQFLTRRNTIPKPTFRSLFGKKYSLVVASVTFGAAWSFVDSVWPTAVRFEDEAKLWFGFLATVCPILLAVVVYRWLMKFLEATDGSKPTGLETKQG